MSRMTKPIIDDYYSGYYTNGQLSSGIVKINEKDFTNAAIFKLGQYEDIDESPEQLAKFKKALEIIKNKKVDVEWLLNTIDRETYNDDLHIALTQEEYDFLKEVLTND